MRIDLHCHVLSEETMRLMAGVSRELAPRLVWEDGAGTLILGDLRYRNTPPGQFDLATRLQAMDAMGVDAQAVAAVPFTFYYEQDARLGGEMCAVQNEQLAALKREHPERFFPLAAVPLQDPAAAAAELERAVRQLDLSGAGIGTNAGARQLDDPELDVFWAKVQELDVPVMLHPTQRLMLPELGRYYLVNFVGNPLDGTIAITRLVFGGVLVRFPRLKLVFCHGGGYAPYQWGRYDHGWRVRPEPKERLQEPPSTYLRKLYFDTITHSRSALEYLVSEFGADHVVLGTDYPYDMGLEDPVGLIQSLQGPDADGKALIEGDTAARLLTVAGRG